jgi:hypothetical protein
MGPMSRLTNPLVLVPVAGVVLAAIAVAAVIFAAGGIGQGQPAATATSTPTRTATATGTPTPTQTTTQTPTPTPTSTVQPTTKVFSYQPALAATPFPLSGDNSCWTNSIASQRADAFRCSLGNDIHDPCFPFQRPEDVSSQGAIVCPGDPRTTSDDIAFAYDLSQLPHPSSAKANPWFMVVDGNPCGMVTGTLPSVGGVSVPFSCTGGLLCNEPQGSDYMTAECGTVEDGTLQTHFVSEVWK